MSGIFIVFEGLEGVGKSTQLGRLVDTLRTFGHPVIETREPGGTQGGEALRDTLLHPAGDWSPLAEALMMNAARDAHLRQVILPALDAGQIVICDRFSASTRAYQGGGGGVSDALLAGLEDAVVTRRPDMTIYLDLPLAEGLERADRRGPADRFEGKDTAYHQRVADRFKALASTDPQAVTVSATGSIDDVAEKITQALRERFPDLLSSSA